ncbi:NAD(P)-binding protein [Lophium mytilinum]|uniref:NAD(P)-binding protein n=1 Tax=Lophium mytilinum TaxID=390894 RepID=A0A6A6QLT4_9PEZI|nr:NAD(P)-binding protein [Lophium mytilinum]
MGQNILITGAAGYIGGSVLADFISRTNGLIKAENISAAVRSEDQVQALSKLGVNVIQVDLRNEAAVNEAVLRNEIDVVVHTASAIESRIVSHLIKALDQRRKASGEEVVFIHSSVTALFATEGGWTHGEVKDTDQIFEMEKQIGDSHPVRETNILVIEQAKAHGVTSLNVVVPTVYGRGRGEWRKLSVSIPAYIRTSIKLKLVYKFDKDSSPPAVHISDLTALYALLVEKILHKEPVPNGENGYYFPMAHRAPWWDVMELLAEGLHARGLVLEPKAQIWPSDEMAAEELGFPLLYIRAMCTATGELVPINAYRLGWQPKWDLERFLGSMDDEIEAVQELDKVKPTVFDAILPFSNS